MLLVSDHIYHFYDFTASELSRLPKLSNNTLKRTGRLQPVEIKLGLSRLLNRFKLLSSISVDTGDHQVIYEAGQ